MMVRKRLEPRVRRVLGLSALFDLVLGLSLLLYGRQADHLGLQIAGGVLGLAGVLIGTWVVLAGDRPEQL